LLITAAIILNCAIFSALFRPLPEVKKADEEEDGVATVPTILEPSGQYATQLLYQKPSKWPPSFPSFLYPSSTYL
jgi:hypothetical protein